MDMNKNSRLFGYLVLGTLVLMIAGSISCPAYAVQQNDSTNSAFSWEGVYIGPHIGYGWGDADTRVSPLPDAATFVNLAPTTLSPNPDGLLGGGQLGVNWQRQPLVFGVEKDFSWSGMSGSDVVSPITQNNGTPFLGTITTHQDTDWFGTLRGRVGFTPTQKVLIYGTGGLAYGRVNYSADTDFRPQGTIQYPADFSKTNVGWTVGGGAEIALGKGWSVKVEYLYYDLGRESFTANPSPANPPFQVAYKWDTAAHTMNVGLNYRF